MRLTGSDRDFEAWQRFYGDDRPGRPARSSRPSPSRCRPRAELRARSTTTAAWQALFERPIGETVEADLRRRPGPRRGAHRRAHRHLHPRPRPVAAAEPLLPLPRHRRRDRRLGRAGRRDGRASPTRWRTRPARPGPRSLTGCEVDRGRAPTAAAPRWSSARRRGADVAARHVLVNAAPQTLAALLGEARRRTAAEGAQLKVNMLLRRLPRLRDRAVDPREAFAGTFHVAESYGQLATAYEEAAAGRLPSAPPSEIYCHSLTDPSILGPELAASGRPDPDAVRTAHARPAVRAATRRGSAGGAAGRHRSPSSTRVLAEPLEDCLARGRRRPAVHRGQVAAGPGAGAAACPAGTSSTATCPGRTPRTGRRAAGASRPRTRTSCCAGRARCAAAG